MPRTNTRGSQFMAATGISGSTATGSPEYDHAVPMSFWALALGMIGVVAAIGAHGKPASDPAIPSQSSDISRGAPAKNPLRVSSIESWVFREVQPQSLAYRHRPACDP